MVFSSTIFLFLFLPLVLLGYYVVKGPVKNIWLLCASLFFYAWGEPKYVVLMLLSILINYLFGLFIEGKQGKVKKAALTTAILINLLLLGYFKYFNFIVDNINRIFRQDIQIPEIALPIGISFYTFQILSYVVDVYRGHVKAQKNILNLGLYISLFPQLIAGPIVRYVDVEKQIRKRTVSLEKFSYGMRRFMEGFIKKVLIADQICKISDYTFSYEGKALPALLAWLGAICYAIQIYFDFSGYSDMAIGLGKMFGFDFLENFNYPYVSKSIKEFWRRWHISLSSWFRDYLYIPLGGNRVSNRRTYLNLFIVFACTGIWHGANWTFLIWGIYYGIFLVLERGKWGELQSKLPGFLRRIYTLLIVLVGWVLFRADNISGALNYLKSMFLFKGGMAQLTDVLTSEKLLVLLLGIALSTPIANKVKTFVKKRNWSYGLANLGLFLLFFCAICYMVGSGFSPFLYFRF